MKMQTHKSTLLLSTLAGIVILLGIAGGARTMGWLPSSIGGFGNILGVEVLSAASAQPVAEPVAMDLPQAPSNARGKRRCPECGVIVSMREIDASGPHASPGVVGQKARSYEFTVRLEGGLRRVIIDANPASWRPGEHVIVIAGSDPSHQ